MISFSLPDVLWECALATENSFRCHACPECDGHGCAGELPGMGGVSNSRNFQLNCAGWRRLREQLAREGKADETVSVHVDVKQLGIGPVTGAEQNIGYEHEADFYFPYFSAAHKEGIALCAGDGCPDIKLQLGIEAVRTLRENDPAARASFFLKPYPNEKLFERIEIIGDNAEVIGNDIDSYNIVTMRNQVHLERKTPAQIAEIRAHIAVPYAVKGVFTEDDISLVKESKPDIVVISNHGGRVETRTGSTAEFLADHAAELKKYCGEIWVDGGIRTHEDVQTALYLGASRVLAARPFITALITGGQTAMEQKIQMLLSAR